MRFNPAMRVCTLTNGTWRKMDSKVETRFEFYCPGNRERLQLRHLRNHNWYLVRKTHQLVSIATVTKCSDIVSFDTTPSLDVLIHVSALLFLPLNITWQLKKHQTYPAETDCLLRETLTFGQDGSFRAPGCGCVYLQRMLCTSTAGSDYMPTCQVWIPKLTVVSFC